MPRRRSTTTPTRSAAKLSFAVRIWGLRKVTKTKTPTYEVRWIVAGKAFSRSLTSRAAADNVRSELRAALNRGEGFDVSCGLPVSMLPDVREIRWWDWALEYVDLKWPTLAPTSRLSLAEALVTVTLALLSAEPTTVTPKQLRSAMQGWAFNSVARAAGPPPEGHAAAIAWLSRNTRLLGDLDKPALARDVLAHISRKLDGRPASATTAARKRMVFHNCLALAVERELLTANPLDRVRWRPAKNTEAVDPATVVNPTQARALLDAVRQAPGGERYVAFFGLLYYAGARPSEAIALHWDDIQWPERDGDWGWLRLRRSQAAISSVWTDTGRLGPRQLKHRPSGTIRPVPCAPALLELLRDHRRLARSADHRVFCGPHGAALRDETYRRVWQTARARTLTSEQVSSALAKTPYTLRHACVSTWLAAGVDPTQVAAWAGHSVAVLLRVYAHVIDRGSSEALTRIAEAMQVVGDPAVSGAAELSTHRGEER